MKNYYEELEIDKNASKEIIEKVYKVLAKKYHPDTTQEANKQTAEEKFKAISEAYEILSNEEKRKKYDIELEQFSNTISYEEYLNVVNQRNALNNQLNNLKKSSTNADYDYTPYNKVNSNVNTEKIPSAFAYIKYKIKEFFTTIFLLTISILITILLFNTFSNYNLFSLFVHK